MTALGGFAMSAITALTAQNTQGVQDICDVPPAFVTRQISAVLSDLGLDAIKTGMLPKTDIIEAFALAIDDYEGPLVADPVMVASSGDRLLQDEAVAALQSCLLVRADLVTPNLPEAEVLTGRGVETLDDMKFAADALMNKGVQAALIKGGHLARSGSAVVQDLLATQAGFQLLKTRASIAKTRMARGVRWLLPLPQGWGRAGTGGGC